MFDLVRQRLIHLSAEASPTPQIVKDAAAEVRKALEADTAPTATDATTVMLYLMTSDLHHAAPAPEPQPAPGRPPEPPRPASGRANGARTPQGTSPRHRTVRDPTGLGLGRGHYETRGDGRRVFVED